MAVQRRHVGSLMAMGDVVGVGTGLGSNGEPVIRVLAARAGIRGLPAELEGVPVESRVSGRLYALRGASCEASGDGVCQSTERWPLPVPIGISIGHPAISAGTIGARVTDGLNVMALSNNHVLANSNLGQVGDAALQPGSADGGSQAGDAAIGTLHDFEPLAFCTGFIFPVCPQTNLYDAAIAISTPAELGFATPAGEFGSAPGYGAPNPQIHPAYGLPDVFGDETLSTFQQLPVQKHGRSTGLTTGTIDIIQLTVDVCYDEFCSLIARFGDQFAINGAFSASGDSGALIVTNDALRYPVALLFAGSDSQTIVSRIDLVLDRFGVTIDDGGTTGPVTDAALESLTPPPFAIVGETAAVGVVVRNVGSEPLAAVGVVFDDLTESVSALLTTPPLGPGAQAQLDFPWTPAQTGPHDLAATLQITDDQPANDQALAVGSVLLEPPGVSLRLWNGAVRTDAWTTVTLDLDYGSDMVVVCTPLYDVTGLGPLVARVRNASGSQFEVGLGRPWFGAFPGEEGAAEAHCVIARAGVYDETAAGARMEAVRLDGFSAKDDAYGWVGQTQAYGQSYIQPVVVGQVISQGGALPGEIGVWSAFWARGPTSFDPPSASQLFVGRHTGEDPGPRPAESLAYLVIEAGQGRLDGHAYVAALGSETIRGVDDGPPFVYPLPSFLDVPRNAVASSAGMDGIEGGWPILYGADAVQPGALGLAIEEDWYFDPERSHTTEQVAHVVFGLRRSRCGLGFELVLLVPLRAILRRRRALHRPAHAREDGQIGLACLPRCALR
jgi:hypothetical protein